MGSPRDKISCIGIEVGGMEYIRADLLQDPEWLKSAGLVQRDEFMEWLEKQKPLEPAEDKMSDNEKCRNEPPKCDNKDCDHYRKDGCLAGCTPPWELKALQDKIAELEADKERVDNLLVCCTVQLCHRVISCNCQNICRDCNDNNILVNSINKARK